MSDNRTLENCPASSSLGHSWTIANADIKGRGAGTTAIVEVCERCRAIKRDVDAEVVGDD